MAKAKDHKKVEKQDEAIAVASFDEIVGNGLSQQKEQSEPDQSQKDFAQHPKFAKFNSQGSEKI